MVTGKVYRRKKRFRLSYDTEVEMVASKDKIVIKKIMTFRDAREILKNKKKGWRYQLFQVGFCSISETKNK